MKTHSFKSGETVTVLNRSFAGEVIIEGEAKIIAALDQDETYTVEFEDGQFTRTIEPDAQADPQEFVRAANADIAATA